MGHLFFPSLPASQIAYWKNALIVPVAFSVSNSVNCVIDFGVWITSAAC